MRAGPLLVAGLLVLAALRPAAAEPPVAPRKAAGDSLLFSSAALALIEAARRGVDHLQEKLETAPAARTGRRAPPVAIQLSAIVYHAPDDWRVWLNGQSFTPRARPPEIEILEVTPGAVRLAWHGDPAGPPRRFELQPNQSYLVASGRIVEGRAGAARSAPPIAQGAPR